MDNNIPNKMNSNIKYVIKRDGRKEPVCEDKIFYRIQKLINDEKLGILDNVSALVIAKDMIEEAKVDNITTTELDNVASKIALQCTLKLHLNYNKLAIRIMISNLHKNTTECFSTVMESLFNNVNSKGEVVPIINERFINVVRQHKHLLNEKIDYTNDYNFTDFFGLKTLEDKYLLRKFKGKTDSDNEEITVVAERPMHLIMRVAIGIHYEDIDNVIKSYDLMSKGYFTHATPTLFNSGTVKNQMSSCFILKMDDSMDKIYKNFTDCALISKSAGGIGMSFANLRPEGSFIRGTNGKSKGIVKILKVANATANFANQGGKRNGSFAIYNEPWHGDIYDFLDAGLKTGDESHRARDLFYGLWIPDAFMEAVKTDNDWYLMNPDVCKGLTEAYGKAFNKLYYSYVEKGMFIKKIKARDLFVKICNTQINTGMPYVCFKDAVNEKSNQKNLGTIQSSNLCAEINIYHDADEYGTCNIATVSLPKFVEDGVFNFKALYDVVKAMVLNLNRVIDNNYYPVPETKNSNLKHRPTALGTQGLSNTFFLMKYPFDSESARKLNKDIFETIQFAALESSMELSIKEGKYSTFEGSPSSKGIFQHNMWGVRNEDLPRYPWDELKEKIIKHGLRNSLLTASPPTASTSQILGNYESFEPINSNVFTRTVLSGDFTIINSFLIEDLIKLKLWDDSMYQKILKNKGSVQNIPEIPQNVKDLYKTVWEIKQKTLIDYSTDRAMFTDQTQSLNLYVPDATVAKMSTLHMYAYQKGLKTGMYYLRTKTKAQQIHINTDTTQEEPVEQEEQGVCYINNPECSACSG